jgi:LDH2 family malate/lactate/ureidoglycolate dehydrogenase
MPFELHPAPTAEANGIGAVSVTNSHHFGIAGYYARMIVERGLIGLVASNSRAVSVVPTRAATRVFGTNPLAFAAPTRRNPPFLLDMSTSTVAGNKIKMYALKHKPLPPGWALDEKGQPIVDAALAREYITKRDRGGLTPIGGTPEMSSHKGYGLAMMVQILGSTLAGGSFHGLAESRGKQSGPDNIGHFFLAIDPQAFRPGGNFEDEVDEMIEFLHSAPTIDPSMPVLVAGDPELQSREQRSREGVPIPEVLIEKLRGIARRCGAPFLLG